jgi:hypothetical protein
MRKNKILKESADWWKIFANRIIKEASNQAIENGCNGKLVENLLTNSNIFVEKSEDGYVLFNNNCGEMNIESFYSWESQGTIYASSEQVIWDAIKEIGEDNFKKYVLGVK